jgi:hypothetical protein
MVQTKKSTVQKYSTIETFFSLKPDLHRRSRDRKASQILKISTTGKTKWKILFDERINIIIWNCFKFLGLIWVGDEKTLHVFNLNT